MVGDGGQGSCKIGLVSAGHDPSGDHYDSRGRPDHQQ